jgi:hypothetical protein
MKLSLKGTISEPLSMANPVSTSKIPKVERRVSWRCSFTLAEKRKCGSEVSVCNCSPNNGLLNFEQRDLFKSLAWPPKPRGIPRFEIVFLAKEDGQDLDEKTPPSNLH